MFGFISEDEIVGKGQAVFWPLKQVRSYKEKVWGIYILPYFFIEFLI